MKKILAPLLCWLTILSSPTHAVESEFTIGPEYAEAPEIKYDKDVPRGTVHEFTMDSKDSQLYPGIAKNKKGTVPYQRKVAVYVPAQYHGGRPIAFIVAQDGLGYRNILPHLLDNMIAAKRLPMMVAIMINSGGGDSLGSQRGLEYDTLNDVYTQFIEREVLPRIEKDYKINFTSDPEGRATMGGSSGAAAAFTMTWSHPELYRRVLSYSGTFVNQQFPVSEKTPHGAWEYHENLIKKNPPKPIRIWLHVSDKDNGWDKDEASYHNWVMANQRMVTELKAKGYSYRYVFAKEAKHNDSNVVKQTLPAALEWLWDGYKPK
jgi:enterochelin esterase-like enzyme